MANTISFEVSGKQYFAKCADGFYQIANSRGTIVAAGMMVGNVTPFSAAVTTFGDARFIPTVRQEGA